MLNCNNFIIIKVRRSIQWCRRATKPPRTGTATDWSVDGHWSGWLSHDAAEFVMEKQEWLNRWEAQPKACPSGHRTSTGFGGWPTFRWPRPGWRSGRGPAGGWTKGRNSRWGRSPTWKSPRSKNWCLTWCCITINFRGWQKLVLNSIDLIGDGFFSIEHVFQAFYVLMAVPKRQERFWWDRQEVDREQSIHLIGPL